MREFSKIKCTIWSSRKFSTLSDPHKMFYLYLHTNGRINSCGCYNNPVGYIGVDLKWTPETIISAYKSCKDAGLVRYETTTETVFIEGFFCVNAPHNPKHAIKVMADIAAIQVPNFKKERAEELKNLIIHSGWRIEEDCLKRLDILISTGVLPAAHKIKKEKNGDWKKLV